MESTEAILLRKRKFSDTSLIVSWCTESLGCIQTVAKGARRPKSPFAGKLDLFFEGEISIVRSRKSDLHTLTEVVLKNPFAGIRSNYLRTQTAAYFVELIEICTERDHREPELFMLLHRAFGYLDANDPTSRAVSHFETELARIAGVHDEKKFESRPGVCAGNFVCSTTAFSYAALENTGDGGEKPEQSQMKLRNLIAAVLIAGLSPAVLANETYRFDPSGSTIGFSVHQFLGTTHGKFTKFSGKIDVDREHPENSSVTAQIDVRSIDTRIKKRDDHLRSAEFFNVEKFPQMTFKSRSVKQTGPQSGDILGDLTIHGVTKPITLHVKLLTPLNQTSQTRWAVTTQPITRRDFNLMFAPAAESVSGISQTVAINIEVEAKRGE